MLTSWQLYWLTRLDSLGAFLTVVIIITACVFVWAGIYRFIEEETPPVPVLRWAAIALLLSSVLGILTPGTKEMAAIIVLPKLANNQDVQAIGQGITDLAKAWLEELKPKPESP